MCCGRAGGCLLRCCTLLLCLLLSQLLIQRRLHLPQHRLPLPSQLAQLLHLLFHQQHLAAAVVHAARNVALQGAWDMSCDVCSRIQRCRQAAGSELQPNALSRLDISARQRITKAQRALTHQKSKPQDQVSADAPAFCISACALCIQPRIQHSPPLVPSHTHLDVVSGAHLQQHRLDALQRPRHIQRLSERQQHGLPCIIKVRAAVKRRAPG